MRGVPVSLILSVFLILIAGVADAREGHDRGRYFEGGCHSERHIHKQRFEGRCRRPDVEEHDRGEVSEGVKCRARVGFHALCSHPSAGWRKYVICCRPRKPALARESAGVIRALHEEIWDEREKAEDTVEDLHDQLRKNREEAEKTIADLRKRIEDQLATVKTAEVTKKEADLKTEQANKMMDDAKKLMAAAKEAFEAAGELSSKATKEKQDAQAARTAADAEKDKYQKLNNELTQQQAALLKQAENAKHREDEVIEQIKTRWDQIFVNLRSVDPCKVAAPGSASKSSWDNTAPKAETNVAAETESGKNGADRTRTELDATGARSTGMSERSRASLE